MSRGEGWLRPRGHEMICFSWICVIDTIFAQWKFETSSQMVGGGGSGYSMRESKR